MAARTEAAGALKAEAILRLGLRLVVPGQDRQRVMADLMKGLDTPTARANADLWRISRMVRSDPFLVDAVRNRTIERLAASPERTRLLDAMDEFLRRYGHREGDNWYLSSPSWRRAPDRVWGLLSSLVSAEAMPPEASGALGQYSTAQDMVLARLAPVPVLARLFLRIVRTIRGLTTFREESHFDLTRPLPVLQAIASEWGQRLHARGLLDKPEDVHYLTRDEVEGWLSSSPPTVQAARALVVGRRATYQLVNTRWHADGTHAVREVGCLNGRAAAPGRSEGRARLVRGEEQFHLLGEGEILVCPHTNPSWTPLFAVARAVVTETGGPASHAAMVAREYGVPCVMGVSGLMGLVRDGDELVVDGSRGLVYRVWREEPGWSGYLMDLTASGPSPPPRSPSRRTAGRSHSRAGTEACSAPSGSAAGAGSQSGSSPSHR